ncbi:hypothetical protein HPB50_003420 [Hyalomma asiaticum]|uniref:Uncharacterized protein n=1 Tax=Hyalomma asiaticum TaxID=266040 RepID=A0ACB7SMW2_HYAAI|nr:hypothetical protein HPB50_003420 [Hyalomma asiaticum]
MGKVLEKPAESDHASNNPVPNPDALLQLKLAFEAEISFKDTVEAVEAKLCKMQKILDWGNLMELEEFLRPKKADAEAFTTAQELGNRSPPDPCISKKTGNFKIACKENIVALPPASSPDKAAILLFTVYFILNLSYPYTFLQILGLVQRVFQKGPGKQPWVPSDCRKVCSLHFKQDDYREGLKMRKLKPDAIPSIFPSYPAYMQGPLPKERKVVKRGAGPGLSPMKLHVEAKKYRPDILNTPSERIGEVTDEAVAGSSVSDQEAEMMVDQEPSFQSSESFMKGTPIDVSLVDLGGAEVEYGLEEQLAAHSLCFIFVGLSTHYRLPVGYYFTKGLTGEQLELLCLNVMSAVEEAGFKVTRLVADNHSTNCKFFASLSGGHIRPIVTHPLDPDRPLYLSFDYCHVLKNIRNQFLDTRRIFRMMECGSNLHDIQEKQAGAFKLVRCLTKKHLWPSNFEKMSVSRAVAIFCPQVTTVLRFLQKHGRQLGFHGFEDCLPIIEFMELIHKWFTLHNIKSTSLFWRTRDALKCPSMVQTMKGMN